MCRVIIQFLTLIFFVSVPFVVSAEMRWQFCANEGGFCDTRGPAEVRYGAEGRYVTRTVSDGVNCDNSVFGDPAPGVAKRCLYKHRREQRREQRQDYGERQWQVCANEGGYCDVRGTAELRYGAEGRYVYKMVSRRVHCDNSLFGDPAPGVPKHCQIRY